MSSSKSNLFMVALLLVSMTIINTCGANASTNPKFPAIVIFGDLTVDPGNNNYIDTIFKGNIAPYGINFPGHVPTGRSRKTWNRPQSRKRKDCGLNCKIFVFWYQGMYLTLGLSIDTTTISFGQASSGVGIGRRLSHTIRKTFGTNDLIFNFFDLPTRRLEFDISGYQSFLLQRLEDFVKQIYDLGCRNIVVAGLPPVGCLPVQMTFRLENPMNRQCLENQNSDARSYNKKLVKLLPKIQVELPRSKLVYTDIYQPLMDMITHPQQYGIVETTVGCCGTGVLGLSLFCNSVISACGNPSQYVFWDSVHPTQKVYQQLAKYIVKEVVPKLLPN
ncbi:hypothetical protein GOBAR_AA04046 [Gossypium barbadense]|uniref:GDSL esterase/lipase n=1 Tax=Gossypium barbadense TaxID=3634 RepID=A0A2P5YLQ4_GOSBA|nr:hypothetical protein GOBAR_AA04046 [Gossypium barbadense]